MSEAQKLYSAMLFWNEYLDQPPMPPWESLPHERRVVLERAVEDLREQDAETIQGLRKQLARR